MDTVAYYNDIQVGMQNKDNMSVFEEATCEGSDSACKLALQKIDWLEVVLGDIKNVSFFISYND